MQSDATTSMFTKQIQLLLVTREEDFKELSQKIAEVQRIQNSRLDAMLDKIKGIEQRVSSLFTSL